MKEYFEDYSKTILNWAISFVLITMGLLFLKMTTIGIPISITNK